jgi:predicted CxxxxCH...CXXCH cytochrome family protein
VNVNGTINVTGGRHMNGAADFVGAHPVGWASSTAHGYSASQQGLQACTSCHVAFGAVGGAAGTSCNDCHTSAGHSSWQTECTFCHGTAGRAFTQTGSFPVGRQVPSLAELAVAPPVGPQGQTASTDAMVGAHQRHVNPPAGLGANPIACTNCHASPLPTDVAHVNGQAVPVPFGGVAITGNIATAAFNPTTLTCSATYCHGNFTGGVGASVAVAPTWTGGAMTCTSCHAAPPSTGQHGRSEHRNAGCGACHSSYTATSVNVSLHVNGVKDVGGAGTSINTWNRSTGSCTPTSGVGCHGSETW